MESKICTYTEKNVRLQLVRVESADCDPILEIRFNRKVINCYRSYLAKEAMLSFLHYATKILLDRSLSDLTTQIRDVRA